MLNANLKRVSLLILSSKKVSLGIDHSMWFTKQCLVIHFWSVSVSFEFLEKLIQTIQTIRKISTIFKRMLGKIFLLLGLLLINFQPTQSSPINFIRQNNSIVFKLNRTTFACSITCLTGRFGEMKSCSVSNGDSLLTPVVNETIVWFNGDIQIKDNCGLIFSPEFERKREEFERKWEEEKREMQLKQRILLIVLTLLSVLMIGAAFGCAIMNSYNIRCGCRCRIPCN